MQPKPEEVAAVAGAVAVVGGVGERVGEAGLPAALDGFARAAHSKSAGVDQQQIVEEPGALGRGEMRDQRLDRLESLMWCLCSASRVGIAGNTS